MYYIVTVIGPMQVRYDQKMAKYGRVAEQNSLRFIPVVFSHTDQIHGELEILVLKSKFDTS